MAEENIQPEAQKAALEEEQKLIRKARIRASFKIHALLFILVNALFWVIWYFVFRNTEADQLFFKSILFVTIAWFIILVGHYIFVYKFNSTLVEKELAKLKKQIEKDKKEIERLKTVAAQKKAELQQKKEENNTQE